MTEQLKIEQFYRKSFPVDAVQVTETNIDAVAEWCRGSIHHDESGTKYIKVRVDNPLTTRQTQGFVGDWVLYAGKGYKVYRDRAFGKSFTRPENTPDAKNVFEGDNEVPAVGVESLNVSSSAGANPGGTSIAEG